MNHSVLVVEDEPTLLETLEYNLERQGYTVLTASNGFDALKIAREAQPDMLVLDIMLPGLDGLEVCRTLRQEMNVPILMLTARAEEIDKIIGLEVGADDYMTKPFGMRELMARVKAQLRRVRLIREELTGDQTGEQSGTSPQEQPPSERMLFGELIIDLGRREVFFKDAVLTLKPKAFELLVFLANHRGIALSRELILERVWGWDFDGGSRTVDVHVRWLREKIEDNPTHPGRIVTVRGVGYRFDG
ncbi:MAG: response regulator transcription factor [Chloroflexota bacterium]